MSLTQINKAGLDEIALDHVFTIGASGSSAYTFQGEGLNGTVNNPTLYLTRGKTYRFENGSGGHPFRIQSTTGTSGTAYNTGVTNNNTVGTVIVEVQHDAPDVLYYQCTSHAAMNGILYITGALADGGVTTAKIADSNVTTAKIAADAVTGAKIADDAINSEHYTDGSIDTAHIADSQVTTAKIADNAVTTAKLATDSVTATKIVDGNVSTAKIAAAAITTGRIADEAVTLAKLPHGTSSNDGKFLRANNGADPSFESLPASGLSNVVEDTTPQLGGTLDTNSANIKFPDSSGTGNNRLFFGSSDDLSIFHNGTVNAIQGANSSNIYIQGDDVALLNQAGNKTSIWCNSGGSVDLHHDNSKKLETTSTGVYVTGGIRLGSNAASNELDDYEEGTWTPSPVNGWGILNGGAGNVANAAIAEGKYVKVGDIVHLYFTYKEGSGSGASFNGNEILFYGLPFTPETDAQWPNSGNKSHALNAFTDVNASGGGEGVFCVVAKYGNTSLGMLRRVNGGIDKYTGSNLGTSGQIFVSGTYRAA